MRTRLLLAFLGFAALVLGVLWLFQTFWLDDIYRSLRLAELQKSASELSEALHESESYEQFDRAVSELASENGICVSVYEIREDQIGKSGVMLMEKHVNTFCFIHNIGSSQLLNSLYSKAIENGGEYLERVDFSSLLSTEEKSADSGENVIRARVEEFGSSEVLMLFNTELIPLGSTVSTLRMQLLFISGILVVLAVIIAFIISSRMSKPIREMSVEASKLALGNYNVNFDGGGCSETENLSVTLNHAAYELSRLDKMQKDLIANVSHDLRTPLTMISGYTEAMRDLPGEATPENMQIVIDETKRLTNLVNDMLEVSRYQGGTQELKVTRFNLTDVIRTTFERYGKLRERDGYSITFEDRIGGDVFVEADEGKILQVMYNLVGNAVNYTGEDKAVIIRQSVVFSDSGEADEVMIEVIDHGIGISEEELPLVWERYYKVNDFHRRANMGTGLGLSIVKSILLLHCARFGVRSSLGEGSCFWYRLKIEDIRRVDM